MNKVLLEGYVEGEPMIRYFNYKHVRADFIVRTEEYLPATDEIAERNISIRHSIRAWAETAQTVELYIRDGQRVALEGRLTYERIEGAEGTSRTISVIDCRLITILAEAQVPTAMVEEPTSPAELDWSSFSPDDTEDPMA